MATTGPKDAKVEEEARRITDRHLTKGLFAVDVVAWEEIQELLEVHRTILFKYYPHFRQGDDFLERLLSDFSLSVESKIQSSGQFTINRIAKENEHLAESVLDEKKIKFLADKISIHLDKQETVVTTKKIKDKSAGIIPADRLLTLGVIAKSVLDRGEASFQRLLPSINWRRDVAYLKRKGVVETKDGKLFVDPKTKRVIFSAEGFTDRVKTVWIDGLEKLKHHPDALAELALHYIGTKESWKSAQLLIDSVHYVKPRLWDELYCDALERFDGDLFRFIRTSPISKVEIRHAVCQYKINLGEFEQGIVWAKKMRVLARKPGFEKWAAKSYLLSAECNRKLCQTNEATRAYDHAIRIADSVKDDKSVLGDALFEKFDFVADSDSAESIDLLRRAELIWHELGNSEKQADCSISRGEVLLQNGTLKAAAEAYRVAIELSETPFYQHGLSHACLRLGQIELHHENLAEAMQYFQRATKIAIDGDRYIETASNAMQGEAIVRIEQGRIKTGRKILEKMRRLCKTYSRPEGEIAAIYNIAQTYLETGDEAICRKLLKKGLSLARANELDHWIVNCHTSYSISYFRAGESVKKVIKEFCKAAEAELLLDNFEIAAEIHKERAVFLMNNSTEPIEVEKAFDDAKGSLKIGGSSLSAWSEYFDSRFEWTWEFLDNVEAAAKLLSEFRDLAKAKKDRELECRISLQIAACHLSSMQPSRAKKAIDAAKRLSKKTNASQRADAIRLDADRQRQLGKIDDAINLFKKALVEAIQTPDFNSKTGAIFGHATALWDAGKQKDAKKFVKHQVESTTLWTTEREKQRILQTAGEFFIEVDSPRDAKRYFQKALRRAEIPEEKSKMRFSLAHSLYLQSKFGESVKMLEGREDEFEASGFANEYYGLLAASYSELEDARREHSCWKKALEFARSNGDIEDVIEVSAILAYQYEEKGKFDLAEKTIEDAIRLEQDPEKKTTFLLHQFGILLQDKRKNKAEKCFEKIRDLANQNGLFDVLIDAHAWLGDYYWEQGLSKKEAVKAYLVAELYAISTNVDRLEEQKRALLLQLASLNPKTRVRELNRLEKLSRQWLENDCGTDLDQFIVESLLMPFRVGVEYSRINEDWSKIPDEIVDEIIDRDFAATDQLVDD